MGVDWYPCTACNETYPDCGDYYTCMAYTTEPRCEEIGGCERSYCSKECAKPEGEGETLSCVHCREELTSHENLLGFLLARHGQTREQVAAEYVAAAKAKRAMVLPGEESK